jgi:hypothetical protein
MGTEFTFFDYLDADGINTIKVWLDGPGKTVKAKVNNWLRHLEATPPGDWKRPLVDTLTDECAGLFEIRVEKSHLQYRILGFHGPGQRLPTLGLGIRKPDDEVPVEDCMEALRIKELVEVQPGSRRVEHDFSG